MSNDESLRHGPEGLSMSPGEQRGRVRLTLSPSEEKKRTKALERTERMLSEDIRIAGSLLEMIEAGVLPRAARAMPSVMEGPQGPTGMDGADGVAGPQMPVVG